MDIWIDEAIVNLVAAMTKLGAGLSVSFAW